MKKSTQSINTKTPHVVPVSAGRIKTIFEILLVFGASIGLMWGTDWISGFENWQREVFGNAIISRFLYIIFIPILAIWWIRNKGSRARIMNLNKVKEAFKIGGKSFSVMMPVTFLSFPVVGALGLSFYGWKGGLIIAGWHLLAVPVLCLIFKGQSSLKEPGFSGKDMRNALAVIAISSALIFGLQYVHTKVSEVLISLVFIGFSEEFMFRGYMQGRLNQAFGKPFTMLGFSFGWGLLLASLLFGLAHVLSPANPLHWAWGLWTFIAGICFGIIREKGGSFLASALVHGIIMVFPVFFS